MQVKLSVVIITLNEERNLERCLRSVRDVADEVIVVDSYSTDNTESIALKYGARFIQHPFEGHIQQKNYALQQASYPHVLSLDADEALSPRLKRSILKVKENWKYDGYYFNRLTNYCGKWIRHASWYPARKLRLVDRRKAAWGGRNPHDKLILEKGCRTQLMDGDLLHYSYYTIREHIDQINRFTDILAQSYLADGKTASWFTIIFHPLWRGFRDYVIKAGFLDGFFGLVISVNSAHETFLKYIKLRRLILYKKREQQKTICFFNTTRSWGGGEKWHFDVSTRMQALDYPVILVTNKKSELFNRICKTSVQHYSLRVANLSFLNPIKIWQVMRFFQEHKVRTVIMNLSADVKLAGTAAYLAGVRNIIYRRGSAIPITNHFINRYIFGNFVTEIIANSEETKRTVLINNPLLFDADKISVIYNGINLRKFDELPPVSLFERIDGEVIIGNAGRLVKQKAQKHLIDLAVILKSQGLKFRIVIAGEGKLRGELTRYAQEKGVIDSILFLGFVDNIKAFMESIDIFCLTSLWEGFGYVLIEAMACCKPVVAFDISSNPEIIAEGTSGYLVENGDVSGMAEKIIELIQNPEQRTQMGLDGRKRVEEIFDMEKTFLQVKTLIDQPDPYLLP